MTQTFPNPALKSNPFKKIALLFLVLFATPVFAVDAINTGWFGNTAIKGYDPVAYFSEKKPVKGNKKFSHNWMGADWHFSNQANRELFKNDPEKYAPQYGGYCAYAVSQNSTAGIDPEQFTIHDGKLYLNYNASINKKWLNQRDSYIVDADKFWPGLLKK